MTLHGGVAQAGGEWQAAASLRGIVLLGEALVDVFPDREVLGGAPFNVARNLAALGDPPLLLTRLGADAAAARIEAECRRWGLVTAGLQHDAVHPTGRVQVQLHAGGHGFRIEADAAWDHLDAATVLSLMQRAAPALVYFGTLAQRAPASRQAIRGALGASSAAGARCFLDLNLRGTADDPAIADASLARADVVKVNDDEFAQLQAWFGGDAERLVARFACERLVITRGARGWACFDATEGWLEGPAPAVDVADSVGAGDAFSAVLLLGMARGWPLRVTLQRAGRFAAEVCRLRGAVDADSPVYAETRRAWGPAAA